jgi:alginate O-acetyltransferase complex protein AlgI
LHGLYLIGAVITQKPRDYFNKITGIERVPWLFKIIQVTITFALVSYAWIFFRANYFNPTWCWQLASHVFTNMPTISEFMKFDYIAKNVFLEKGAREFFTAIALIIFMEIIHYIQRDKSIRQIISTKPTLVRWSIYYLFIMLFFILGVFDSPAQFIYFQF